MQNVLCNSVAACHHIRFDLINAGREEKIQVEANGQRLIQLSQSQGMDGVINF